MMRPVKQVIVIRKDLKMRRGKEIAQGSHSSIAFLTTRIRKYFDDAMASPDSNHFLVCLTEPEIIWIRSAFTKVCLQVQSEEELLEIHRCAKEAGLECNLIQDSGRTEFAGVPTYTCLAIGPDFDEKINSVIGHLSLY